MAAGGIRDQLGGGFHRYATDAHWLVPALRADALRQRPARARLRARVGAHGRPGVPRDGDRRRSTTWCASSRRPTAASRRARTRTRTARRARRSSGRRPRSARCWATRPRCSRPRTASTDDGNWEGHTILSRVRDDAELGERFGLAPDEVRRAPGGVAGAPAGAAGDAAPARARRQGAGRPGTASRSRRSPTRHARSGRPATRRSRRPRPATSMRRGRGRRGPARAAGAGRPAAPLVEGRPRERGRRPRGLREPRATGCSRCTRRPSTSAGTRRPSAWSRRSSTGSRTRPAASSTRPTMARRSIVRPKGTAGQRDALAAARWRRPCSCGSRALTGERPLPGGRRAGARDRRPVPRALPDGLRAVAVRAGARPTPGSPRSPSSATGPRRRPGALVEVADRGYHPFRVLAVSAAPGESAVPLLHGPVRAPRSRDGVRVPRLRVPAARPRAGGARRPPGRVVTSERSPRPPAVVRRSWARPGRQVRGRRP